SFDKANRTSIHSYRGPGLEKALQWLGDVGEKFHCKTLTDVHESAQVAAIAEICQGLQIPAFLCRQTDLLVAAAQTGRYVNIKKGQFLAPAAAAHLTNKMRSVYQATGLAESFSLCERGTSFGYGDLVVDMRALATM